MQNTDNLILIQSEPASVWSLQSGANSRMLVFTVSKRWRLHSRTRSKPRVMKLLLFPLLGWVRHSAENSTSRSNPLNKVKPLRKGSRRIRSKRSPLSTRPKPQMAMARRTLLWHLVPLWARWPLPSQPWRSEPPIIDTWRPHEQRFKNALLKFCNVCLCILSVYMADTPNLQIRVFRYQTFNSISFYQYVLFYYLKIPSFFPIK